MSTKQLSAILLVIALFAMSAFAQRPCPPTADICVSQNMMGPGNLNGDEAHFTSIQTAVNAAQPGQVIEILDTAVYTEQVLIFGMENPGPNDNVAAPVGVTGGKNGITIRYTPVGGWSTNGPLAGGHSRPTILHRDMANISPQNQTQAQNEGLSLNHSGNFHTNGALRIIAAQNIIIDGIRVDGGGRFTYGTSDLGGWDLAHGNAGIAVTNSGSVIIRNVEVVNAAHGIYVCDRNIGGVFANRNPHDNIPSIPLGNYGQMGNHIFEYNRIHQNNVGMYFHSVWDLGSTIRFNLIFDNFITVPWGNQGPEDQRRGGGIRTRDMRQTPLTIHNNTFHNNRVHIEGAWQSGNQHLQYNNIYGSTNNLGSAGVNHPDDGCAGTDSKNIRCFTRTMHASVMAASPTGQNQNYQYELQEGNGTPQDPCQYWNPRVGAGWPLVLQSCVNFPHALFPPIRNACQAQFPSGQQLSAAGLTISPPPPIGTHTVTSPVTGDTVPAPCWMFIQGMSGPGSGTAPGTVIPNFLSNSVYWLQVGGEYGQPLLFQSTNPNASNFLHPTWSGGGVGTPEAQALVGSHIEAQGWLSAVAPGAQRPDLGAIQRSGWQPTITARIHSPFPVVVANNGNPNVTNPELTLMFHLTVEDENGRHVTLENAQIHFMRWNTVTCRSNPQPWNPSEIACDGAANVNIGAPVAPTVSPNIISNGVTTFNQQFTGTLPLEPSIGYYEIIVRGTVDGQTVVSNVGILPYRRLEHQIVMGVYNSSDATVELTSIQAGQAAELRVRVQGPVGTQSLPPLHRVDYSLTSNTLAEMWCGTHQPAGGGSPGTGRCTPGTVQGLPNIYARRPDLTGRPLRQDNNILGINSNVPVVVRYPIFFTRAGNETIYASGEICQMPLNNLGNCPDGQAIQFLGIKTITVTPGPAERVGFVSPMPRSQLEDPFGEGACRRLDEGGPGPGVCHNATTISRGLTGYPVDVEVQDRFDNLVTSPPVEVAISSHNINIGDVGNRTSADLSNKSATTNADGIAEFRARVTFGEQLQFFDMTALLPGHANPPSTQDIARLRVGRPLNALMVFFSDGFQYGPGGDTVLVGGVPAVNQNPNWNEYWNDMREINEQISETRHMIIIKAASPDGVITEWGGATTGPRWVRVTPDEPTPGEFVRLFAGPTGGEPTNVFTVQPGGYAVAWIAPNTSRTSDIHTSVTVNPCRDAACTQPDTDLEPGWRGNIRFFPSDMNVRYGAVFAANNGNGRPDSLMFRFEDQSEGDIRGFLDPSGGIPAPRSVTFYWPRHNSAAASYERRQEITVTTNQAPTATTGCFNFEVGGFDLGVSLTNSACNVIVRDVHGEVVPGGVGAIHNGYTNIDGGANRFATLALMGTEEGEEGRVFTGFSVYDGLGPIIALTNEGQTLVDNGIVGRRSPGIVENLNSCAVNPANPDCQSDVLRIQTTEAIRGALIGNAYVGNNIIQMLELDDSANPNAPYNAGAGAQNLIITGVGSRLHSYSNELWLTLADNSPAPRLEDGASPGRSFWIRLNPESDNGFEDFAQNAPNWPENMRPHPQNRWVQVVLIPTPPAINPGAWYTSDDRTGFLDTAVVVFNKPGNIQDWLVGGSLRLGSGGTDEREVTYADIGTNIRWLGGGGRDSILVIDLQWLHRSRTGLVTTSGVPQLFITFSPGMGWDVLTTPLADHASPVLANDRDNNTDNPRVALLTFSPVGDNDQPIGNDTLRVRFSEPVDFAGRINILQLHVHSTGQVIPLPIGDRHIRTVGAGGQFIEATFELDPQVLAGINLTSGLDSLRIIPDEIRDVATDPNWQMHPENRAVPLVLDYKSNWTDVAKNNPGRNDPDRRFEIVINRGIGNVLQEFTAEFVLYNNMGNVVLREKIDMQTDPERARGSSLVWSWDGRNHRGRLVGTGTYLLRANIISDVITEGGAVDMSQRDTHTINRLIGFVR